MALIKAKIRGQRFVKAPGDGGPDAKVVSITDLETVVGDQNSFILPELLTGTGVLGFNAETGAPLSADTNFYLSSTNDAGTALASGKRVIVSGLAPGTNCIVVAVHKGRDGYLAED